MEIFATPCDGHVECMSGKDEAGCDDNQITNIILAVSMTTVFLMFIALRIIKEIYKKTSKGNPSVLIPPSTGELLEKLDNNIHDNDNVEEVNLYLWNSVHTQTIGDNKEQLLMIFEFLASKHNLNEAEMYA